MARALARLCTVVLLVGLALAGPVGPAPAAPTATTEGHPALERRAPRLAVSATPARARVARGVWTTVTVKVRNPQRAKVRRVSLRLAPSAGTSVRTRAVAVGVLRGKATKAVRVQVRLDASAARAVVVQARVRKRTAATTRVSLTPRQVSEPTRRWTGNFTDPTPDGLHYDLTGSPRTVRGFTAAEIPGYCVYQGQATPWYPTAALPDVSVAADGTFDRTFRFPPSNPDDFDETVRVRGRISGGSVVGGRLDYTATWEYGGSPALCTISNAYETWTASPS